MKKPTINLQGLFSFCILFPNCYSQWYKNIIVKASIIILIIIQVFLFDVISK